MRVLALELDDAALRRWLGDFFCERGVAALAMLSSYETPTQAFLAELCLLDPAGWQRVSRLMVELVPEAATWPFQPLHLFLVAIEEGGFADAVPVLVTWLGQPRNGEAAELRRQLAIRTLLGLGWTGTPAFWRSQASRRFSSPELIFRGMAAHGLDRAFEMLPSLAASPEALQRILRLFPRLAEQYSVARLAAAYAPVRGQLPAAFAETIDAWLASRH